MEEDNYQPRLPRLRWSAYEFEYREKTNDWFWAVGIIIVCIASISIIYSNILFAVFIVLAGGFLILTSHKEPRILDFRINEKGFYINDTLYEYSKIVYFWVEHNKHSAPKLLIRLNRSINPILIIPIETDVENSESIRDYLLDYIPEEKIHEPASQKIMEYLGF